MTVKEQEIVREYDSLVAHYRPMFGDQTGLFIKQAVEDIAKHRSSLRTRKKIKTVEAKRIAQDVIKKMKNVIWLIKEGNKVTNK